MRGQGHVCGNERSLYSACNGMMSCCCRSYSYETVADGMRALTSDLFVVAML